MIYFLHASDISRRPIGYISTESDFKDEEQPVQLAQARSAFRHADPTPFSYESVVCSLAYTVVHFVRGRIRFGEQLERYFSHQGGKEEPCTIPTVESIEMIAAKFHSRPLGCHRNHFHSASLMDK